VAGEEVGEEVEEVLRIDAGDAIPIRAAGDDAKHLGQRGRRIGAVEDIERVVGSEREIGAAEAGADDRRCAVDVGTPLGRAGTDGDGADKAGRERGVNNRARGGVQRDDAGCGVGGVDAIARVDREAASRAGDCKEDGGERAAGDFDRAGDAAGEEQAARAVEAGVQDVADERRRAEEDGGGFVGSDAPEAAVAGPGPQTPPMTREPGVPVTRPRVSTALVSGSGSGVSPKGSATLPPGDIRQARTSPPLSS